VAIRKVYRQRVGILKMNHVLRVFTVLSLFLFGASGVQATLYGADQSLSTMYSINTTTAALTTIGSFINGAGGAVELDAMAFGNGILYGADQSLSTMYSINTTTAALTTIGSFINGAGGAVELDAMAFAPDAVPEPTTLAIFVIGLAGLAVARRRRKAA
jgi:hypothetical protein